jgi:thioredoxin-dependent peroxiredoxin
LTGSRNRLVGFAAEVTRGESNGQHWRNDVLRKMLVMSFVSLLFGIVPLSLIAASRPEAGQVAPEFALKSQDGSTVSLNDYRGKWVVLYFYPKDFTSGCTLEAHNFQRDEAQYQKLGAVILGVSLDSADSHKSFCVKEGLTFKLLADTDHNVSKEYGALTNLGVVKYASRETFLIDPQGKIAKVYTGVKPETHSAQVLADLEQLQSATAKK